MAFIVSRSNTIQVLTAVECRQNKSCEFVDFLFDDVLLISRSQMGYKMITSGEKKQI
jgi:hypothetical protein